MRPLLPRSLALALALAAPGARAADAVPAPAEPPAAAPAAALPELRLDPDGVPAAKGHGDARYFRTGAPFDDPGFPYGPTLQPKKNYWVPLIEVPTINIGIWSWNYLQGKEFAQISLDSIKENFNKGWIVDTDDFWANQMLHPYHGSLTFNAARSMGLSFYESWAYAFAGSLMWEQFMEVQPPSMNDQVNTPFGGTMLGEVLWRMHRLILDSGGYKPSGWRQFGAFVVSPAAGANHFLFGDEYRGPLELPTSWMGEFRLGAVMAAQSTDDRTGARNATYGPWFNLGASIVYGIPGTPDLKLRKPFDHFEFEFNITASDTPQPTASLVIQGLLEGKTFGNGSDFGGLWGLYGSHDFVAPQIFRAGGFGLGPGVSIMKRWDWFELHATALGELMPWAAAGSTVPLGVRDYHYGPGLKGYLQLWGQFDDRATLKLTGREYWVSGTYERGASEDVSYLTAALTVRVFGPHALESEVAWSRRRGTYPDTPDIHQSGSAWKLCYAFLQGW